MDTTVHQNCQWLYTVCAILGINTAPGVFGTNTSVCSFSKIAENILFHLDMGEVNVGQGRI